MKNIWTKSEMRRTSQPGSMMKPAARSPRQLARKVVGGISADFTKLFNHQPKTHSSERRFYRLRVELSTVRVAAAHRVEERVRFGHDEVALVLLQPLLLLARQPRLFVGGGTTED